MEILINNNISLTWVLLQNGVIPQKNAIISLKSVEV